MHATERGMLTEGHGSKFTVPPSTTSPSLANEVQEQRVGLRAASERLFGLDVTAFW